MTSATTAAVTLDDGQLMARTAGGDMSAFGELVDRHKDGLVSYLSHLAGGRERAEDYAQEAFLRLFHTARRYRDRGRFAPFLYRIATNLVRSDQRREQRWRRIAPALTAAPEPPPPLPQQSLLEGEVRSFVSRAIDELPLAYRVPLVLYEIEGWPYQRIAEAEGCREGTVKSRIHRARKLLKERLAPYWNGGSP